jgi:uncharacterized membrane protein
MPMLIAAALVFLAIHALISGTRLRDTITASIGEGRYMGLFALSSIIVLIWMVHSYNVAVAGPENRVLYDLGPGIRHAAIPIIAIAFLLGIPGLLAPNPTSVRQENAATDPSTVRGVLRITRHPFLWGVAIWAAFHTAANGDLASVIFFGTFLVLALFGTFSIDAKRKRKLGAGWDDFAAKTSLVPFAAIAAGRNRFVAREIFDWRFWAAAAIFVVILFLHNGLFGASPFPNGWVPF